MNKKEKMKSIKDKELTQQLEDTFIIITYKNIKIKQINNKNNI